MHVLLKHSTFGSLFLRIVNTRGSSDECVRCALNIKSRTDGSFHIHALQAKQLPAAGCAKTPARNISVMTNSWICIVTVVALITRVTGHGALMSPPSRNAIDRFLPGVLNAISTINTGESLFIDFRC